MNVVIDSRQSYVLASLGEWLTDPLASTFPYDDVLDCFHETGKEFVDPRVLDRLATVRDAQARFGGSPIHVQLLRDFLDMLLDKRDGTYDYPSYVGLKLLLMPSLNDTTLISDIAVARRDRLTVQLLADCLAFELDTLAGLEPRFPGMRPEHATVVKRIRLALRVARPAIDRTCRTPIAEWGTPEETARRFVDETHARQDQVESLMLRLSLVPVFTHHDEYFFIRVLQLFETTFATMSVLLRRVIAELTDGDAARGADLLATCARLLRESAPLFSLLATMQVPSFQEFRTYTEGASAIQSRNYKLMESLCRRPDESRLHSLAYTSVPEVQQRVFEETQTVDSAFAVCRGRADVADPDAVRAAMAEFTDVLLKWRQTHYSIAVRMLGERSGTGYTEGTPYLSSVRTIPVFLQDSGGTGSCPFAHGGEQHRGE